MEMNPYLSPARPASAGTEAGKGYIEAPEDKFFNMVWQTREVEPDEYQLELCGELEAIFAQGKHELKEIVQGLQQSGATPPDGREWTEETFMAEMRRLGI